MRLTFETPFPAELDSSSGKAVVFHLSRSTVSVARTLSEEEWTHYQAAVAHVSSVQTNADLHSFARDNYQEFLETQTSIEALRADSPAADQLGPELSLALNRRLSNFLSSFRAFLDHSELRIKRQYGNTSAEAVAFKSACSLVFDRSFAYRFAYKLRNYSQHFGLPIGHIQGEAKLDPATGDKSYHGTICFDIDTLLSLDSKIWGSVLPELRTGPPLLPVGALLAQVEVDLREILQSVLRIDHALFMTNVATITATVGELPPPPSRAEVGNWENDGGRLAIRSEPPPFIFIGGV